MTTYKSEIDFIKRKLPTLSHLQWQIIPAMQQLVSQSFAENEAKNIVQQFRNVMLKKAGVLFPKIVFSVPSKLGGGVKVVLSIPSLREAFSDEIDGWSGGGGKGYNPFKTNPSPMRGGGV